MVGEKCWNCMRWEEHFYWDHLQESSFHFMKVMDGDFSQRMELPPKFSKCFRVDLLDVVALNISTGKSWEVRLWKEQDHFYFNGGWEQFVEANKIELDHTLIFKYSGDSSFTVRVFDRAGCIMVAPDPIICSRVKRESEDQNMSDLQTSHSVKTRNYQRVGPSRICKQEADDLDSDSRTGKNTNPDNTQEIVQPWELKLAGKQGSCSFVKLITKKYFSNSPFMAIPVNILLKHIPNKPLGITICNQKGKKHFVNCRQSSSSWGFSGKNLSNFLRESNIRMGDICVFKLRKQGKKMVIDMSIVQA